MSVVSELMSPRKIVAVSIKRGLSALNVSKLMIKNKVGSVVLVDSGKPVGIITERDLLIKFSSSNKPAKRFLVKEVMSSPVITIKSFDSIETAAAVMAKNKVKRLVVVEQDGSLAGVLSVTDIARKLAKILADDYSRYAHMRASLDI